MELQVRKVDNDVVNPTTGDADNGNDGTDLGIVTSSTLETTVKHIFSGATNGRNTSGTTTAAKGSDKKLTMKDVGDAIVAFKDAAQTGRRAPARIASVKRLAAKGAGLAERRFAALPPRQQEGVVRESGDCGLSRSGLRIHLLESGRHAPSEESRAFPGWRAVEIHRGLNEPFLSEETLTVVSRVGRALGEREGTGPEDDPMLREQRIEGRAEGFSEGRAEGLAEGRTAERADVIRTLLRGKGIAVAPDFPEDLPSRCLGALGAASWERILAAASAANSFADFLARLEDPGS